MGVSISAPYIYVCTRMRMRKSKLLPREEYQRMLNMSVSEITRIIGETEYKQEIDELGTTFKGIDLVEVALSWNLAKEYQKIQQITPGTLKQFTQVYLRTWDIQNVLNILRGKMHGEKAGKIKEILIPAGSLDKIALDRMLSEESADRIIELLKDHRMYPVLAREYPLAKEAGSFSRMENELYKHLYANIINDAKSGVKGGASFLAYIQLEIDIKNVKTLFRLKADKVDEEAREMFIPGGSLSLTDFASLNNVKDLNEFVDMIRANIKNDDLHVLLDEVKSKKGGVQYIEARLTRVQLAQMEKMSKRNPFSIHPILVYLEKKKYEVFNLRALARGKESKLPSEKIVDYLVM